MPQIIVIADEPTGEGQPPIMLQERVSVSDFESPHFANQLVERLGWAVGDADEITRGGRFGDRAPARRRSLERELALSGRSAQPVS